ncbi:carboxypeptidase-like regulatory domain-containing protein [Cesiribacter sp. SM1]|uniref:carboxypeptidase-like regulatory domain-containing protein n=1 Tax=Cesiribacter sp. SM1 TaxID=2861196 RepID=UPI001CD58485|nr:carboxypeptidase-like regulatory domain-containing protein [Cesiribacter sp. SM1]
MKKNYFFLLFTACILLACAPSQILKTSLRVTVLDELGNPVEGASILLYGNESDYRSSKNPVVPKAVTNNKGIAKISELEPKSYFIDVRKGDMNNFGGGIQTDTLQASRINKINVVIE